jgi:hypothetical protein
MQVAVNEFGVNLLATLHAVGFTDRRNLVDRWSLDLARWLFVENWKLRKIPLGCPRRPCGDLM